MILDISSHLLNCLQYSQHFYRTVLCTVMCCTLFFPLFEPLISNIKIVELLHTCGSLEKGLNLISLEQISPIFFKFAIPSPFDNFFQRNATEFISTEYLQTCSYEH